MLKLQLWANFKPELFFYQDFKDLWKSEQARIDKEIIKEERLRHKQKAESLRDFKTEPR